jgi:hypothetical protein
VKPSAWLAELHRQWHEARGRKLQPSARAFSRPWEDLLDAAGLRTAAERSHALGEAAEYEKQGRVRLRRHRYRRHLVEAIDLPPASESWLITQFSGKSAQDLRNRAIALVTQAEAEGHPRWPESWQNLCRQILEAFTADRNFAPFFWKDPSELAQCLALLRALTTRDWPAGTLIRDASAALDLESKALEKSQRILESALSLLFGEETTLESLGLAGSQSRATVHGPLTLHFADGSVQPFDNLRGEFSVSLPDLQRAVLASTSAGRILSIENAKTTFRQAAAANLTGDTLLVATSYPNAATRRLLELLPAELPHFHFGDTDASGYAILRSLRGIGRRPVARFHMNWCDAENSAPLSEHDRRLLPSLKSSPALADCLPDLLAMESAGRKGRFEQEALGPPILARWPFWEETA